MAFKVYYGAGFEDKDFVQKTIDDWNNGEQGFTLHTSGSTGLPKAIELPRELLEWSSIETQERLQLSNEHIFCCLPVQKTGGYMQLIRAIHLNYEITLSAPTSNPLKDLDTSKYSIISVTPHQLTQILKESTDKILNFKNVLIGGSLIEDELLELIAKVEDSTTFWETYGMTETASHFALKNLSSNEKLFTANEGVVLDNKKGCLSMEIPELNFKVETTDLVILQKSGFRILGRIDDVINSGGVKIHPAIVEPQIRVELKKMGLYRSLYLAAKQDDNLGQTAVLVIEGNPIKDEAFLMESLRRNLPQYQAPKEVLYVEQITRTINGKVIRTLPGSIS